MQCQLASIDLATSTYKVKGSCAFAGYAINLGTMVQKQCSNLSMSFVSRPMYSCQAKILSSLYTCAISQENLY